ncbi:MmgE/PrpD family protein [Candidatus Nitrospira bockiana]
MTTIAERLARFTRSVCYDDLPQEVVHEVKRRILDSLACAFGAWDADPCRIARRVAASVSVPEGATIWGTAHKTSPDLAAFANGALVRYLDFNDTYLSKEPAHPSDNIPAVLAAGELAHKSGQRVIQGLVVAYEVHCRLCDAAGLRPRGWDHVTYGPFSSALGVAKVLKFTDEQTRQAINLAGVSNVALRQTRVGDMSMWKACAFSNAARNGVFAALLAREGMTGPSPIFEGEKGFMKLVSGPLELAAFGGDQDGAATVPFKIRETYIKHFPVEYHAQTAVEAALALRSDLLAAEGPTAVEAIEQIEVGSYDVAIEIIGKDEEKWRPKTRETADHSFPYCVAVALRDGVVDLHSFDSDRLDDPALQAMMQRVKVVREAAFVDRYPAAMPTRVTVRTATGRSYTRQVEHPLGHPKNPMSDRELEEKFMALSVPVVGAAAATAVAETVWKFETLSDIGELMPLLKVSDRE